MVDQGPYIQGPEVERFEHDFARQFGLGHVVGVNTGTDAVAVALRALGVGPGDEVLTVALTAAGTGLGILMTGAEPRFVDVDPGTRTIDPAHLAASVTPRTAAVVPVHLHGFPAAMREVMACAHRHGLAVVEDCAQAHGAMCHGQPVGTWGHAAAFSFYPTKNLGTAGDGGAVATGDKLLAERIRMLAHSGWSDPRRISQAAAWNTRLDALQAAVLNVLLLHLEASNRERRAVAAAYRHHLTGLPVGLPPMDDGAVYHQFALTVADRDRLRADLEREFHIGTAVHYPVPLHCQPAFAPYARSRLPVTEQLADTLLSLPVQPEVVAGHEPQVAAAVRWCLGVTEKRRAA